MKSISLPHIYSDRLMLFIINSIVTSSLHNRIRNYIKSKTLYFSLIINYKYFQYEYEGTIIDAEAFYLPLFHRLINKIFCGSDGGIRIKDMLH